MSDPLCCESGGDAEMGGSCCEMESDGAPVEFEPGDAAQPTPKMRELLENPSVLERDAAQTEHSHLDTNALAREFHDMYERLAPHFGWKSQTPVPWEDVPEANRLLMRSTINNVLGPKFASLETKLATAEQKVAELKAAARDYIKHGIGPARQRLDKLLEEE